MSPRSVITLLLGQSLFGVTLGQSAPPGSVEVNSVRTCKGFEKETDQCDTKIPCSSCVGREVNCEFSAWTDWYQQDGCVGLCIRQRGIGVVNNECGTPCEGNKIETKICESHCGGGDPVPCKMSQWTPWSSCDSDYGQIFRERTILVYPKDGGATCKGFLNETMPCGTTVVVDCKLSEWGAWTPCSKTCDGGYHAQMRRIITQADAGGKACGGDIRRTEPCATQPCSTPQNCSVSPWSEWAGCDEKSPYQKYRKRAVTDPVVGIYSTELMCYYSLDETAGCNIDHPPQNCVLSEWADWTECDKSCDGGQQYARRTIDVYPKNGGSCDPASLMKVSTCNDVPCFGGKPDCEFSEWSSWGACSATCGSGEQYRKREIAKPAVEQGEGCSGIMQQVQACVIASCGYQDCEWNDWEEWGGCTCTCGGGSMRRQRTVKVAPRGGGALCHPETKDMVAPCNTQSCENCVDGLWSPWSEWSPCSATCETGYMSRHRSVSRQPNNCGQPATGLEDEYKTCAVFVSGTQGVVKCFTDKDCLVGGWSEWSSCTCSCFGVRERHRTITQYAIGLGKTCHNMPLKTIEQCNPSMGELLPQDCGPEQPAPCTFTAWSAWEKCTATCGGGQTFRSRQHSTPPVDGLACSGELVEWMGCNTHSCEQNCIDCKWGMWGDWSACGKECVSQRYRWRHVDQMPNHCGQLCNPQAAKETESCSGTCTVPKYCAWTEWTVVGNGACSAQCGAATYLRQRSLAIFEDAPAQALIVGEGFANKIGTCNFPCGGTMVEQVACQNLSSCTPTYPPVNCAFGLWASWSTPTISQLCERHRVIMTMNDHGGKPCDGPLEETKFCPGDNDPGVKDCLFGAWTLFSKCTSPEDQSHRSRVVLQAPMHGGRGCEGVTMETKSCSVPPPPVTNCKMQAWTAWTPCSATCDAGIQTRERRIERRAINGGEPCKHEIMEEMKACSLGSCNRTVVDCEFSDWVVDGSGKYCEGICVNHQARKTRTVKIQASLGGKACSGALVELFECDFKQDCVVSSWTEWDTCDKTCGGGQKMRHRQVTQNPRYGGKACPAILVETTGCNAVGCGEVDCQWGKWSAFGPCTSDMGCGKGQMQHSRSIAQKAEAGGQGCTGPILETMECDVVDPSGTAISCESVDCVWADWGDWSHCTCECDGGQKERYRGIRTYPVKGGQMCDPLAKHEVIPCNTQSCSKGQCIDGEWEDWSPWGKCSVTCESGVTTRFRKVAREANFCGNVAEGKSYEVGDCQTNIACEPSVDCIFGEWNAWSGCTTSCDGVKRRERLIVQNGKGQGKWCEGAVKESAACNSVAEEMCGTPQADCQMSDWFGWGPCSATCGGGVMTRERQILSAPANGGQACPKLIKEAASCATNHCASKCTKQDCLWGDWGEWSACDKCGGQKRRFRRPITYPKCGGIICDYKSSEEITHCPRQCHEKTFCGWTLWTEWSKCSSVCGIGSRDRTRHLDIMSAESAAMRQLADGNLSALEELDLEEDVLEASFKEFAEQAHDMEGQRMQELVVAFGAGLASIVVGSAVLRWFTSRRDSTTYNTVSSAWGDE